jgi:2-isopropylmalate synthase
MGYNLSEKDLNTLFARFKELADKKKNITDNDLDALVSSDISQSHAYYQLDGLQVTCGTIGMPTASVRLVCPDGVVRTHACIGTGPIDASYKAIDALVQIPSTLKEFAIHAITEGIDAVGEVSVRVESQVNENDSQIETEKTVLVSGYGADDDILVASVKSYLSALNRLMDATHIFEKKEHHV